MPAEELLGITILRGIDNLVDDLRQLQTHAAKSGGIAETGMLALKK
jgi:hypothetical protein